MSTEYAVPAGLGELLTAENGQRYGVWVKAAHKSLVWHLPSVLPVQPATWDELVQRTRSSARSPGAPAGRHPWPSAPRTAGC